MIFIAGAPRGTLDQIKKPILSAFSGSKDYVTGRECSGALTTAYAEQCLETISSYVQGRPDSLKKGLAVLVIENKQSAAPTFLDAFFPFALVGRVSASISINQEGRASLKETKDFSDLLLIEARRLVKIRNTITSFLESRAKVTPLLLPILHFGEAEHASIIRCLWEQVPNGTADAESLATFLKDSGAKVESKKNSGGSTRFFENKRGVRFVSPGRYLHGKGHTGVEGHKATCFLNSSLRLGGAILDGFHYDCTKNGGVYTGTFTDCHGGEVKKVGKPHLNVYPNDYIR